MSVCQVEGAEALIARLDEAVRFDGTQEIAAHVMAALTDLINDGQVHLPKNLCEPRPDCYARRLVHRSEDQGYEVIAMCWGPGQGTPLHDHAGVWCVEGVYQGEIEVRQFNLIEEDGDLYRFEPQELVEAHVGMSGSLIPPFEYHTINNHLSDQTSVTIHVYGTGMTYCHVFEPEAEDWYRRRRKEMSCDE